MAEHIDYGDLDPERAEAARLEQERAVRWRRTLAAQAEVDAEWLMKQAAFRRWFFTVLGKAGIYQAAFHPHQGAEHYAAGRRGLGIELLNDLLRIDPKIAIDLSVEQAKLEEKVNDPENQ